MSTYKRIPTDHEAVFAPHELFVSRTDGRGIIKAGNEVFARISGFTIEELVEQPHNIIRHPDMPKAVFKLLWDTLGRGEVIAAYVKNMAKDGSFYWVLATVFPFQGGYLSVRLKPTTSNLKVVEGLYREVLSVERSDGMERSSEVLLKGIKDLGFADYKDFMRHVLYAELRSKESYALFDELHMQQVEDPLSRRQQEIRDRASVLVEAYRGCLHLTDSLAVLKKLTVSAMESIRGVSGGLESLSVNMAISAHQLGKEGGTLSVVASSFQTAATQVLQSFVRFEGISEKVARMTDQVQLDVLCSLVLMEMLTEEAHNVLRRRLQSGGAVASVSAAQFDELEHLVKLTHQLIQQSMIRQKEYFQSLRVLQKESEVLHNIVIRLDLIRTGGKLEGSRKDEITDLFRPFIQDMAQFIQAVDQPISEVLRTLKETSSEVEKILSAAVLSDTTISESMIILEHARFWLGKSIHRHAEGA